jgi:NadR type nicotinamide-nucleotide adenylyltransferase
MEKESRSLELTNRYELMNTIQKIVILGPESTGKSTLCSQLAIHYNTTWVPEYAREYLIQCGMVYTFDDLLTIAKGQLALEGKYTAELLNNPLATSSQTLFLDTNMYVMKVWCEFAFGKCHNFILDQIALRKYDLYLLCNVDLPWVKDALREYPDPEIRNRLYHFYKELMINQSVSWIDISGDYDQRLQTAIASIDGLMST